MASGGDGLAVAAYAPSEVHTKVNGADVTVTEATDYPFRNRISLAVSTAAPQRFPLHLRIPARTSEPVISISGQKGDGVNAGTYKRIDREWRKGDRVEIEFPMPVRVIQG